MSEEKDEEFADLFTGIEQAEDKESEPLFTPDDRPRGILSKADREYLCGLKHYAHAQSEANRKQEIRERVENALKDFTYLWLLLDEEERDLVFKQMGEETVTESFVSMVTFMYLSLDGDVPRFQEVIEDGLLVGANFDTSSRWGGKATDAEVDININYDPDVEMLYRRLKEGNAERLTAAEIGVLARAGKLEEEHLSEIQETETLSSVISNIGGSASDNKEE